MQASAEESPLIPAKARPHLLDRAGFLTVAHPLYRTSVPAGSGSGGDSMQQHAEQNRRRDRRHEFGGKLGLAFPQHQQR